MVRGGIPTAYINADSLFRIYRTKTVHDLSEFDKILVIRSSDSVNEVQNRESNLPISR